MVTILMYRFTSDSASFVPTSHVQCGTFSQNTLFNP